MSLYLIYLNHIFNNIIKLSKYKIKYKKVKYIDNSLQIM
jgi:hypothetical protein